MSGARVVSAAALLVTIALIVFQLTGLWEVENRVDVATIVLLVIAIGLFFAFVTPRETRTFFERVTTLKLPGGVELGLTAVDRAERVQGGLSLSLEDLPQPKDEVEGEQRPLDGGAREQFLAVQAMLQKRLRFVHAAVDGLSKTSERRYGETVKRIETEGLLKPDEQALVHDVLGRAEFEIEQLPYELRNEFLDASWRFVMRFATLIHERRVRKRLCEKNWLLVDFEQKRKHRPDFLAYREGEWRLVAARVEPGLLGGTRQRLAGSTPPFKATPFIVLPDLPDPPDPAREFKDDGKYSDVRVEYLTPFLDRSAAAT